MKLIKLLFIALFSATAFAQQGGMWIPSLLDGMNESEMKSLGMKMSASDIYDVNNSSLKDAIAHFNGGCTSEVISPQGLLLTNHHCGYGEIQSHSSVENDYLEDGFWAMDMSQELPNPDLEVTFIIKIEDVTPQAFEGTENISSEAEKQAQIEKNIAKIRSDYPKENWQDTSVRAFFDGNQYMLFLTETYKDIRLVGAPPSSIGKFGSDTDNWVWPRHTGDFALFRIYADKDNKPAEYSEDNVPYTPKHFLPISLDGVEEGDFTMVFGFPGRTQEYLPAVAVEQIVDVLNPARIEIREEALEVVDGYMREDQQIKIQYASKFARIANYWKKWIGESQGLRKSNAIEHKKEFEEEFINRVNQANKQDEYGNLLQQFNDLYAEIEPYYLAREYFMEVALRNNELLTVGFQLYQLENVFRSRGEQSFNDRRNNLLENLEGFYKNYNAEVDKGVFEKVVALYGEKSPADLTPESIQNVDYEKLTEEVYNTSALISYDLLKEILQGDGETVFRKLNADKGFRIAKDMGENYFSRIAHEYERINQEIDGVQRLYMKAQLELFPEARIFPDANGTLRVTYGQVNGYQPMDAVSYAPVTYLEGVMEKYVPGDYEFDVSDKLIQLYKDKDYGRYADKNGKLPVNFIGTNHTTGGNSGSPAIDAHGNLIGLNFDRVWEGTMSDIYYDPEICRNIMVDARYILFIIEKYAGAQHLIEEMKLVHPKNKK